MHFKTKKGGSTIAGVDQFIKGKQHVRAIPHSEIEVSRNSLPINAEITKSDPSQALLLMGEYSPEKGGIEMRQKKSPITHARGLNTVTCTFE